MVSESDLTNDAIFESVFGFRSVAHSFCRYGYLVRR